MGSLSYIWGSLGDFGMTFRSLWVYDGYLGIILADFQKTHISQTDFHDFIKLLRYLGVTLDTFLGALESFWGYFGVTLAI